MWWHRDFDGDDNSFELQLFNAFELLGRVILVTRVSDPEVYGCRRINRFVEVFNDISIKGSSSISLNKQILIHRRGVQLLICNWRFSHQQSKVATNFLNLIQDFYVNLVVCEY